MHGVLDWIMREWLTVVLVGGGGGSLAAVFALWLRYEKDADSTDKKLQSWRYWLFSVLINAFGGAVVSFFLWATYTGATPDSTNAPPGVLAASLAVGVGGVSAVQRFLYVEETLRDTADDSAIAAKNAVRAQLVLAGSVDPVDPADSGEEVDPVDSGDT